MFINPDLVMKKGFILLLLLVTLWVMVPSTAEAQCPMCKASVESNMANGQKKGAGLNKGIIFLLAAPYLAAGSIAWVYYRNYRLRKKRAEALSLS